MNHALSAQDVVISIDGRSADLQLVARDGIRKAVNDNLGNPGHLVIRLQYVGFFFDRGEFVRDLNDKHVLYPCEVGKSSFSKILLIGQEDRALNDADVIADTPMLNEIREQEKAREAWNALRIKSHLSN